MTQGPEGTGRRLGDLTVEDQLDLFGAAQIQVFADDFLQEDSSGDRTIQHLGQGELRLQKGEIVAIPGVAIAALERMGQKSQPFPEYSFDLLGGSGIADRLQALRIPPGVRKSSLLTGGVAKYAQPPATGGDPYRDQRRPR
jgi:hypothetical protein